MSTELQISGMTCESCARHVQRALAAVGARDVDVDWRAGRAKRERPLWRSWAFLAAFSIGDAIPQIADLPAYKTGGSGPRTGGTGRVCADGFGSHELLLRGSMPDAAHCDRQSLARWREPPWGGFDQAAPGRTFGNSGNAGLEVFSGTLRGAVAPTR